MTENKFTNQKLQTIITDITKLLTLVTYQLIYVDSDTQIQYMRGSVQPFHALLIVNPKYFKYKLILHLRIDVVLLQRINMTSKNDQSLTKNLFSIIPLCNS